MGKKLDALLGRGFKPTKCKTLVNLAISRLAVLKNQRQVRCSQARSEVVQLLNLGHHDRALLRVEQVIKEHNMMDAFVIIEGYCHLLIERIYLIANNKGCPDELKEAISGLIFAASRCGEFPELHEISQIFTSRYGKDFAARAVELRNNCGVNPKIIQKFSTLQPSLVSRMKLLKEIASENGITLKLQEESSEITEEEVEVKHKQKQPTFEPAYKLESATHGVEAYDLTEVIDRDERFSEPMKARKKYRDFVSAAQAAFESAANAAAAARAAVELSQANSQDKDDDQSGTLDKIHPVESSSSESEGNRPGRPENSYKEIYAKEWEERKKKAELVRSMSDSSFGSVEGTLSENNMTPRQKPGKFGYNASSDEITSEEGKMPWIKPQSEKTVFDESDDEKTNDEFTISLPKHGPMGFNLKSSFTRNEFGRTQLAAITPDKDFSDLDSSIKQMPLRSQDHLHKHLYTNNLVMGSRNEGNPMSNLARGGTILEGKNNLRSGKSGYDASSDEITSEEGKIPWIKQQSEETVFDESDDEKKNDESTISLSKHGPLGFNLKSSFTRNEFGRTQLAATIPDKDLPDLDSSTKQMPLRSQDYLHKNLYTKNMVMGSRNEDDPMSNLARGGTILEGENNLNSEEQVSTPRVNRGKPVSVRTRR